MALDDSPGRDIHPATGDYEHGDGGVHVVRVVHGSLRGTGQTELQGVLEDAGESLAR